MYYIYSFFITIVIFVILQYIIGQKEDDDKNKKDNNIEKILTFIVIYGISTLSLYFIDDNINLSSFYNEDTTKPLKNNVDINMLRKIPEEVHTGFTINDNDSDSDFEIEDN